MNRRGFLQSGVLGMTLGLVACNETVETTSVGTSIGTGSAHAATNSNEAIIEGTFFYRERMLPPPGSKAIIRLEDVSRMDAASVTIASQEIKMDGKSVPQNFRLSAPSAKLLPQMTYSVSVRIFAPNGKLMWTTDQAHLIDPTKKTQSVGKLMLRRV